MWSLFPFDRRSLKKPLRISLRWACRVTRVVELEVHISMSSWRISTTTLKRINDKYIKDEPMQMTKEKTTKRKHWPYANSLRLRIHFTTCSLLGGNSNHVTTNCANPRNFLATLSPYTHAPNVTFPLRVRSRARLCVYLSSYNTCLLPVKVEFWEIIPPVKSRNKFRAKLFHHTLL